MKPIRSTALILLAAGGSTRMGRPKQQLTFRGATLLERALQEGLKSQCNRLLLILGANYPAFIPENIPHQVEILFNPNWKEGMASSIKVGLEGLIERNTPHQAIITVCDQPYVDSKLINELISQQQKTQRRIVASSYQDTLGVPALFDRTVFPELLALTGQHGAKKIINRHRQKVAPVPFPLGHIDIDTVEDYRDLLDNDDDSI